LPSTFKNAIVVCEIADTEFPGYVYLLDVGVMLKRFDTDAYNFMMLTDVSRYRDHVHKSVTLRADQRQIHGPAITIPQSTVLQQAALQNFDTVLSIRSLEWPTQAAEWSTRRRNYIWPNVSTIGYIVNNGCDMVGVAHYQCRQEEWMSTHQYRLSFSRAETVLLNSWTPTQQIVYHILRFVLHESGLAELTGNSGYKVLSRYHMKTLMMWASESNHSNWWVHSNVIQLSWHMLQQLMRCCESSYCKGYFVSSSNLLECDVPHLFMSQLKFFTELANLTDWIVKHYISDCVKQCSTLEHVKFDEVTNDEDLRSILNSLNGNRRSHTLLSSFRHAELAYILIYQAFSKQISIFDVKEVGKSYEELRHIDQRLGYSQVLLQCFV
jgi:3-methyladenine DNA glycosylase AlkC